MRSLIVAEAYRDLEQVSSRLALTERLAALLAQTPDELLPTVCYPCQGLIAPEFAGVDLGLAAELTLSPNYTATRELAELFFTARRTLVPGSGSVIADSHRFETDGGRNP